MGYVLDLIISVKYTVFKSHLITKPHSLAESITFIPSENEDFVIESAACKCNGIYLKFTKWDKFKIRWPNL